MTHWIHEDWGRHERHNDPKSRVIESQYIPHHDTYIIPPETGPPKTLISKKALDMAMLSDLPRVVRTALVDANTLEYLAKCAEKNGPEFTRVQHNKITTALYAAARQLREQKETTE